MSQEDLVVKWMKVEFLAWTHDLHGQLGSPGSGSAQRFSQVDVVPPPADPYDPEN